MATSMNTARICLHFDQNDAENCWFLVKYSTHVKIEDVINEIEKKYLKSDLNNRAVVLRINNFILPAWESAILLRDNDIVSVSIEEIKASQCPAGTKELGKESFVTSSLESVERLKKKRKKHRTDCEDHENGAKKRRSNDDSQQVIIANSETHVGTGDSIIKIKKPKDKKREKIDTEEQRENENKDKEKCGKQKDKKKKKKEKSKDANDNAESSVNAACEMEINSATESEADMTRKVPSVEVESEIFNTGSETGEKHKSKRHRKRKRKSKVALSLSSVFSAGAGNDNDGMWKEYLNAHNYKGRDIGKEERFAGSLPDKLEPPKYYRHGYRNQKTYGVQASVHKKFSSDSEPEVSESTEQYNFLSKQKENNDIDDFVKCYKDQTQNNYLDVDVTGDYKQQNAFTSCNEENHLDTLEYNEELPQNESYTATPYRNGNHESSFSTHTGDDSFPYNSDTSGNYSDVNTAPLSLERKTLSSGVAVFVRPRRSTGCRELSKQEQLNTTATNVSRIYVNPPVQNFKVPTRPAPRQHQSPRPGLDSSVTTPSCNGEIDSAVPSSSSEQNLRSSFQSPTSVISESNLTTLGKIHVPENDLTDFSSLKPLTGVPKSGDIIAYKVLEISASCTPEVSQYKVAKVISVDDSQMIQLQNINSSEAHKNKFHVEIEDDDEILTNTDTQLEVCLHYSSLLEPKVLSESQ